MTIEESRAYCLSVIRENLDTFRLKFPAPQSKHDVYPATDCTDWTEGFWTGMLWLAYEMTGEQAFLETAERQLRIFQTRIERRSHTDTHDLGFLYTPSCVAAWKLTGNAEARETALAAAACLTERYHEKGHFIQAWGPLHAPDNYRLIVDCLMNLPLLYWASETTGDPKFADIARAHLRTTLANAIREDNSSYHTFFFDPKTGAPLRGATAQGYSDASCWARGQAWVVYGLAISYAYTHLADILPVWKKTTAYFVQHLPADHVPYWDLCFQSGDQPRDTSAAAIAICGIMEMNRLAPGAGFLPEAEKMLTALADHETTAGLAHTNGLLKDAMYSRPNGDAPECNIWGDYFYLEALRRREKPDWKRYW